MNTFNNLNEENHKLTIYIYVYLWYFSFNLSIQHQNFLWEKWIFLLNQVTTYGTVFFHIVFL